MPTAARPALLLLAALAVGAAAFVRQPADQPSTPGAPPILPPSYPAEHRLLAEMAGDFSAKLSVFTGSGKPPAETECVSARKTILAGRFLRDTLDAAKAPVPFTLEFTLGYNPDAKIEERFELTRFSSAAFPTMTERGSFDPSTKIFTFTGDHLIDGKRARTRTIFRLEAYTTHVLEFYVAYEDPADAKKVLTPEFKAYSIEYERTR